MQKKIIFAHTRTGQQNERSHKKIGEAFETKSICSAQAQRLVT